MAHCRVYVATIFDGATLNGYALNLMSKLNFDKYVNHFNIKLLYHAVYHKAENFLQYVIFMVFYT